MEVKDFLPFHNQLNIHIVTSKQYRIGISKLEIVFRSFLTRFKKFLRNLKFSILSNFLLINWLTEWLPY